MKVLVLCLSMLTAFSYSYSQTSSDGDDLNLMDVLELFKDSDSMEEFENALNSSDNPVNNLDLNDDGKVDYIQVIDQVLIALFVGGHCLITGMPGTARSPRWRRSPTSASRSRAARRLMPSPNWPRMTFPARASGRRLTST